jgi:hypothetical protein
MKSFNSYLLEDGPATVNKVINLIRGVGREFYVPFSPTLNKKVLGDDLNRSTAFHIFAAYNAEIMVKGQNKRAGISTFTFMDNAAMFAEVFEEGIYGGTGFVAELEGKVLGNFGSDVYSVVDKSNRRWVDVKKFEIANDHFYAEDWLDERDVYIENFAHECWKNLKKFGLSPDIIFDNFALQHRDSIAKEEDRAEWIKDPWFIAHMEELGLDEGIWEQMHTVISGLYTPHTDKSKIYNKLKVFIITEYMNWLEKFLIKYKEDYRSIQIGTNQIQDSGYNEVIMSNYTIKNIYAIYKPPFTEPLALNIDDLMMFDGNIEDNEDEYSQDIINAVKICQKKKVPLKIFFGHKGTSKIFKILNKKFKR